MKAFLTFALLGPVVGGGTLALLLFPFMAIDDSAAAAASMGLLFILFSPVVGIIPAVTTFVLVHTQRGARQGKVLQRFSAIQGFIATATLVILIIGVNMLANIDSATPFTFNVALIAELLAAIAISVIFGLLGIVPGYICAKVGYTASDH